MVVKEGLVLYKIIGEGIINLSDRFFDMDYLDATKGLEIYKQAVLDFDSLQVRQFSGSSLMGRHHGVSGQ
jgi:hypothetical protein